MSDETKPPVRPADLIVGRAVAFLLAYVPEAWRKPAELVLVAAGGAAVAALSAWLTARGF